MNTSSHLKIDDVSVAYGSTSVLKSIDLQVGQGEFIALVGSSGCGKTTLLRTIAGFLQPSAGSVHVGGRDITQLPPDQRGMALVFQSYALWPHMSVRQNVGYGLKVRGKHRAVIAATVDEILAMLGLSEFAERSVTALSGGQRQRVALGRALAVSPEILLLDEPLSNLDARIRLSVRHEIRALQKRLGITAVHVTHDREEAMVMADRIVILNEGHVEQAGTPQELYNRPSSAFVATFLGADNVLRLSASRDGGSLRLSGAALLGEPGVPAVGQAAGAVQAHFRSEAAEILPLDAPDDPTAVDCAGIVRHASYPGGVWRHAVEVGGTEVLVDCEVAHAPGTRVRVRIPSSHLFVFPAQQGLVPLQQTAAILQHASAA